MINNLGEKENHVGCVGISWRGNKTVNGWKALDDVVLVNINLDDFDGNVTILFLSLSLKQTSRLSNLTAVGRLFLSGRRYPRSCASLLWFAVQKYKAFAPQSLSAKLKEIPKGTCRFVKVKSI